METTDATAAAASPAARSPSTSIAAAGAAPAASSLRLVLCGDVMLGRLVDQLFPVYVHAPEDRQHALAMLLHCDTRGERAAQLAADPYAYPWGDLLRPYFADRAFADLRVCNLETSVTASDKKWPNKAFNYRMHPSNVAALHKANIDYCSLANNHVLDFCEAGMADTMKTLAQPPSIAFSGCGCNSDEAMKPAILHVKGLKVGWFSFSDHPSMWAASSTRSGINFLDLYHLTGARMSAACGAINRWRERENFDFVGVSVHWGPNYAWHPSAAIRAMAHAFIDECDVDMIHGTSSHHIQGIEVHRGKPILYGCGDFIDDYATDAEYRNDLSFLYIAHLTSKGAEQEKEGTTASAMNAHQSRAAYEERESEGQEAAYAPSSARPLVGVVEISHARRTAPVNAPTAIPSPPSPLSTISPLRFGSATSAVAASDAAASSAASSAAAGARGAWSLSSLELVPSVCHCCRVSVPSPQDRDWLRTHIQQLSEPYGTRVRELPNHHLIITHPSHS